MIRKTGPPAARAEGSSQQVLLLDLVLLGNPLPAASIALKQAGQTFQPVSCPHRKETL